MSFVKKAVKKVFKVVKKIGKVVKKVVKSKWFKIAAVVALSVFTAGVAAGGFAAFSGVNSVGAFFGAVGQTMSAGLSAMTGGLMGTSASTWGTAGVAPVANASALANVGAQGGGMLGSNAAGIGVDLGTSGAGVFSAASQANAGVAANMGLANAGAGMPGLTNMSAAIGTAGQVGAKEVAKRGIISRVLSPLMEDSIKGSMLRSGIIMGVNGYLRSKEMEREEWYRKNKTVWGGPAFGGSSDPIEMFKPSAAKKVAEERQPPPPPPTGFYNPALGPQAAPTNAGSLFGQVQNVPDFSQMQAPQQPSAGQGLLAGGPGVPGQQTQPPPATQPPQGRPPGGVQLENERMI